MGGFCNVVFLVVQAPYVSVPCDPLGVYPHAIMFCLYAIHAICTIRATDGGTHGASLGEKPSAEAVVPGSHRTGTNSEFQAGQGIA